MADDDTQATTEEDTHGRTEDQQDTEDTTEDTVGDQDQDQDQDRSRDQEQVKDELRRGDHNLYVRDGGGDGRPVVLIHGWPLSGDSWAAQIPALKDAGYRVVVYDRRGFGKSDPGDSYDYDALADDLANVMSDLDLQHATLVGFSMGGGEVARYINRHGEDRLHSVVFAAAVTPYLMTADDNPDGPLSKEAAEGMRSQLERDRDEFFDGFTTAFFSADDRLLVTEEQRQEALALCKQSDQDAALGCMDAWASTDFRGDLTKISVPTLVIHGDSDGTVPYVGSGKRTHEAVDNSELVVLEGAPHGCNLSHAEQFNEALLDFLGN